MERNKVGFKIGIILSLLLIVWVGVIVVSKILGKNKENSITYTITYNTNGGSKIDVQKVKNGEVVERPKDPTKEGNLFLQWELNGKLYDFSTAVNSDITLTASWSVIPENKEMVAIRFNSDGGSTLPNLIIEKGTKLSEPAALTKNGYKFLGWMIDGNFFNFDQAIYSNIELTAGWLKNGDEESKITNRETYLVNFDSNGGTIVYGVKVQAGEKINEPTAPTRNGYVFEGWYLNNNKHDFNVGINMDVTLIAMWMESKEEPNTAKYTVTYDSAGGSLVSAQEVQAGSTTTQPENPTREGYIFKGWLKDTVKFKFDTKINSDITLIADWKKAYKVSFYSNNKLYSSQTVEEGAYATSTPAPVNEEYIFKGWTLNGDQYDFQTAVTQDITLVALWKKSFKVEFDTSLRGIISTQTVAEGDRVTAPQDPKQYEKYRFYGWFYNGTKYDFNSTIYEDTRIVGGWAYIFDSPNCSGCGNLSVNVVNSDIITLETAINTKASDKPTSFQIRVSPKKQGSTKFTLQYSDRAYGIYTVEIKEDMIPRITGCTGKYCYA